MSISFANAVGNYFNRIGKLGLLVSQMQAFQAAQLQNFTNATTGATAQFDSEPDLQALLGGAYIGNLSSAGSSLGSIVQNVARQITSRMVFRDNPQRGQTLTNVNVLASLNEIVRQMKLAGASVLAQTVTATPTGFTGQGDGALVASVRRPLDGAVLENAFAENLSVVCSADSYTGGATAGNETLSVTAEGTASPFDFNWPLGSGTNISIQSIDGDQSVSSGNLLTNSGFTDWTANVPDNWNLMVGTAGTNINQESSIVYGSASAVRLTGDAAGTLTQIRQGFDLASGTVGTLTPLTQYGVNVWARRDGVAPAAGALTIDLTDAGGTVLLDQGGNPCTFSIDLTGLTTVYAPYGGAFRVPVILPSQAYIRMRLSTALTDGRSAYFDKLSMGTQTQCYRGGAFLSSHSGAVDFERGDYATLTMSNSRTNNLISMQPMLWRLIPEVQSNEILFPSSSTPTISDGLLT